MQRLKVESGIVVFLLFFGTAMIDALRHHTWSLSIVYILLAVLFFRAGWQKRQGETKGA